MRRECTEAKEALSADTEVSIPVLTPVGRGSVRLHRSEFESMIRPQVEETVDALHRAVASAGVGADQLTAVLLVGGSSRIPLVAQLVSEGLGRPVAVDTDPKNAIAKGAALSVSPGGDLGDRHLPARAPRPQQRAPAGSAARRGGGARDHRLGPFVACAAAPDGGVRPHCSRVGGGLHAHPADDITAAMGPTLPPARPPMPDYELDDVEYSYAPAQQRRQPGRARRRGGRGGRRGRPRDGVPVAAARGVDGGAGHRPDGCRHHDVAAPTTEAAPTTTVAIPVPKPPVRPTRVVPPVVTTTVAPPPTTTEPPPPTTTKPPPTTTSPPPTSSVPPSGPEPTPKSLVQPNFQ